MQNKPDYPISCDDMDAQTISVIIANNLIPEELCFQRYELLGKELHLEVYSASERAVRSDTSIENDGDPLSFTAELLTPACHAQSVFFLGEVL